MSDKRFFGSVSAGAVIECQRLQESFTLRRNERKPLQGLMCVLGGISKSLRVGKCSFRLPCVCVVWLWRPKACLN